jgi:DNA-binding response OmpR family regulator
MLSFIKNRVIPERETFRPKVLVIEDDYSLIEVLESLFEISGIDFNSYQDTSDIKSLIKEHQPDLILLDYLLPSTNGGDLCQQLKSDHKTANIPIIIYSAIAKQLLPIDEYHCDCFIEKPFDLDLLVQKINLHCLKGNRSRN